MSAKETLSVFFPNPPSGLAGSTTPPLLEEVCMATMARQAKQTKPGTLELNEIGW